MNARIVPILLLVVLLLLSSCSRSDPLQQFQGEWTFVEFNSDGEIVDAKILKVMSVKVKQTEFRIYAGEKLGDDYTISVDDSKMPAEIDLLHASGERQGVKELGIYVFEDKKLKLCLAAAGNIRPTDFVVKSDSGRTLMVLERK